MSKRKKSNPRIRPRSKRKKKPRSKRSRSQAAKRGWQTRLAKKAEVKRLIRLGKRRQKKADPDLVLADIEKAVRKQVEAEYKSKLEEAVRQTASLTESKVRAELIERYIIDHRFVESDETQIISRLALAEMTGHFEEEVGILADEFNMRVSDIYTIWLSP